MVGGGVTVPSIVVVVVDAIVDEAATIGDGVEGEPPPQPAIEANAADTATQTAARAPEKTKDNGRLDVGSTGPLP